MKIIFAFFSILMSSHANAGTCDLVSGSFKTITAECYTIHNGTRYSDGYKEIHIAYDDATKKLDITMASDRYSLSYKADGKEQSGRPMYEGDKYTAQCEGNHIHTRAEMSALIHPLIHDYTISGNKLTYEESFEGDSSFARICEMDRF